MGEIYYAYLGVKSHEFWMTEADARKCYHSGNCDDDVEEVMKSEYIKRQLAEIPGDEMDKILIEYGVEFDEKDRHEMESLIVWLAAGDIVDFIYENKDDE